MEKLITQDELARQIFGRLKQTPINKEQVIFILDVFKIVVSEQISKGRSVRLTGFGTFEAFLRHARNCVSPQTLEKIEIPAIAVPKFRAGKTLKNYLKNNYGKNDTTRENN